MTKIKRKDSEFIDKELIFYRVRIEKTLLKLLKRVLKIKKMSQQEFFNNAIREFLLKNVSTLTDK